MGQAIVETVMELLERLVQAQGWSLVGTLLLVMRRRRGGFLGESLWLPGEVWVCAEAENSAGEEIPKLSYIVITLDTVIGFLDMLSWWSCLG